MTVFIIRRLMQAALVVILMSFLVFSGVFLIGDPVDMFVADDADQEEREDDTFEGKNINNIEVRVAEIRARKYALCQAEELKTQVCGGDNETGANNAFAD